MKERTTHQVISRQLLSSLVFLTAYVSLLLVVSVSASDAHEMQYDWEREAGTRYNFTANTNRAGAHPRLTLDITGFSDEASRIRFKLPEGMALNPLAAAQCSRDELMNIEEEVEKRRELGAPDPADNPDEPNELYASDDCHPASEIGDFTLHGSAERLLETLHAGGPDNDGILNLVGRDILNTLEGKIYLGEPPADDPGAKASVFLVVESIPEGAVQFGPGDPVVDDEAMIYNLLGVLEGGLNSQKLPGFFLKIECSAYVRDDPYVGANPEADGGVDIDCPLPQEYMWLPRSMDFRFDGNIGNENHRHLVRNHLITNPTYCGEAEFRADFYVDGRLEEENQAADERFMLFGCRDLGFEPTFDLGIAPAIPNSFPAVFSTMTQAYGQAHIRRVEAKLPPGLKVNTPDNVEFCDIDDDRCLSIGNAIVDSWLLEEPLTGPVYLLESDADRDPIRMVVSLRGYVNAKVILEVRLDDSVRGVERFTVTADDLPQLPVSSFAITFFDNGIIKTGPRCGLWQVPADFTGHNGAQFRHDSFVQIRQLCPDPDDEVEPPSPECDWFCERYGKWLNQSTIVTPAAGPRIGGTPSGSGSGPGSQSGGATKADRTAPSLSVRVGASRKAKKRRSRSKSKTKKRRTKRPVKTSASKKKRSLPRIKKKGRKLYIRGAHYLLVRGRATDKESGVKKVVVSLRGRCNKCKGKKKRSVKYLRTVKPEDGSFNLKIPLRPGLYRFDIRATDRAGNKTRLVGGKNSFKVRAR